MAGIRLKRILTYRDSSLIYQSCRDLPVAVVWVHTLYSSTDVLTTFTDNVEREELNITLTSLIFHI